MYGRMIAAAASAVALAGLATACSTSSTSSDVSAPSTSTSAASAPTSAPAPAPNPKGSVSGTCDVSLSNSLNGQNYLTATVTAKNTGNIGTKVRITVFWPQQGFASIKLSKKVRVGAGSSRDVQFHVPVSESQVSNFQNVQLAKVPNDPCHYRGAIISTYGQVNG